MRFSGSSFLSALRISVQRRPSWKNSPLLRIPEGSESAAPPKRSQSLTLPKRTPMARAAVPSTPRGRARTAIHERFLSSGSRTPGPLQSVRCSASQWLAPTPRLQQSLSQGREGSIDSGVMDGNVSDVSDEESPQADMEAATLRPTDKGCLEVTVRCRSTKAVYPLIPIDSLDCLF
jgi:hypothetical protein